MNQLMEKMLITLAPSLLQMLSPEIVDIVNQALNDLADRAKKTASPFDDMFVALLQTVLEGIKFRGTIASQPFK